LVRRDNMKKIKKIKNLTPHDVNVVGDNGKVLITFPSEGLIRLSQTSLQAGEVEVNGTKIPLTKTSFGEAEGLPEEKEDTIYIVSSLVCQAYPDRRDFYIPDQLVRDEQGRVIGCRSLSQNPFARGGSSNSKEGDNYE